MRTLYRLKEYIAHPRLRKLLPGSLRVDLMTRQQLDGIVQSKLDDLLREAIAFVPYYRGLADCGMIDKDNPRIEQFPIIDKKNIRGHEDEFVSDRFRKQDLECTRTSGSTGEPFMFYRGRHEWDDSYACLWRGLFRLGISVGDKRAFVKGVDERPVISTITKIKRWLYGVINRCIVIDAHFLAVSEENVLKAIKRLKKYRPVYLHGYVSSIDLIAATAERHGIAMDDVGIRVIVTESEKLYDFQRERMKHVFGCGVAENYGCVEFGMIAQPDKDGNMCINEDHVYVETDEEGTAIYTNLDAHAFPFIRFKNGDKVTLGDVHDELPYRTLSSIEGRVAETIHLPQGGLVHGYMVMYPISKHMKYLREYQVYQSDIDHLQINVVEAEPLPTEIETQIIDEMRTIVGDVINVKLQKVNSIPLSKRGKRAFVCSEVR